MIDEAERSPLFQAILDWIDGIVVVLNQQRQIVMASENVPEALGVEDVKQGILHLL